MNGLKLVKTQVRKRKWPMFFYKLFFVPSRRETREAQKIIRGSLIISRSEMAIFTIDFSEGKIKKGDRVMIQGREYLFLGANPDAVILEMFLFFDEAEQKFFRLTHSFDGKNPL